MVVTTCKDVGPSKQRDESHILPVNTLKPGGLTNATI